MAMLSRAPMQLLHGTSGKGRGHLAQIVMRQASKGQARERRESDEWH